MPSLISQACTSGPQRTCYSVISSQPSSHSDVDWIWSEAILSFLSRRRGGEKFLSKLLRRVSSFDRNNRFPCPF